MIHKVRFLFFFILSHSFLGNAQESFSSDAVQDSIAIQLALFAQEKIHLHTDRSMYVPGEKIWFKAYIVDALTHQSLAISRYVYIDLINSSDSLVHRVVVSADENRLFHGNILLSKAIPEGDYTLRAYTRHLENLGNDYFFMKPVYIGNLSRGNGGSRGNRGKDDFEVSFFPEGGNFPEGAISRVAFKALNRQGTSETIVGEVVDKEGNRIREVTTFFAGMGSFVFRPEAGNEYFLVCKNRSGQEKRFKLPPAKRTCTISAYNRNKRHFIQIIQTPDLPKQPFYLLVHCRGLVLHFEAYDQRKEFISFSSDQLPSGRYTSCFVR